MTDSTVLQFGSRAGSYFALALFCALFAVLGVGVWRVITRRWPGRSRSGLMLATLLFAGPVALIYSSSLSGFYEAEIRDNRLLLSYLHPRRTEIRLADVAVVRPAPAFKGLWRLHVTDTRGAEYVSAPSNHTVVQAAAGRLRR